MTIDLRNKDGQTVFEVERILVVLEKLVDRLPK